MQSYNHVTPGRGALSQDYWMVAKHINKKFAGNPVFWRLILSYTHLLLLLQPSVLWLSIAIFNNDTKPPSKSTLREFDVSRIGPRLGGLSHLERLHGKIDSGWKGYPVWQTGLPALAGTPTYHVNVIKLKWEIIWTGGLRHLGGLPHLPGVPHLHVNRP